MNPSESLQDHPSLTHAKTIYDSVPEAVRKYCTVVHVITGDNTVITIHEKTPLWLAMRGKSMLVVMFGETREINGQKVAWSRNSTDLYIYPSL